MTSILHLEDSPLDHKLVRTRLEAEGIDAQWHRVETEEAFHATLEKHCPDLILADYHLPTFDGRQALQMALERCSDVPFITVSGAVGETAAVEMLKAGATDYVLKNELDRLGPAVRRALKEAAERSARKRAEQEVREARDAAEAANRSKDHFLAVLSHELRTPLTPVMTAVQSMLTETDLPAMMRETIEMIRRNVELEVKLIDDLLDLTRVNRGKLALNLRPTDIRETVRHVVAICDADLRGKRLSLELDLDAPLPRVLADQARLQQILWNLVKNAVKFTDEGGRVVIRTLSSDSGEVKVEVTDTGVGIDPVMLSKIFNAFEQGGAGITQRFGGLGLGLAISRALTEQHGGTLTAHSDGIGRGATFTLHLPAAGAEVRSGQDADETPAQIWGRVRSCQVLLVEDHLDTAKVMDRVLRGWGCSVQMADTVASALRASDAGTFDVLISDIGLPDGSGFDLIRQILAKRPIKGIALSGFGMEEDLRLSKEAGFREHLVKPVNLQQLEAAVRRMMTE